MNNRNLSRLICIFLVAAGLLVSAQHVAAQDQPEEPLTQEWVENDIEGVKFLLSLTPIEGQSIAALKQRFQGEYGAKWADDEENLGFGARHIRLAKGMGYSSIYIDLLAFNDRIAFYKIGVDGSAQERNRYRDRVLEVWRVHAGPDFVERDSHLSYEKSFDDVFAAYYRGVAAQLGPMKAADVPEELKSSVTYLTSPFENSYVGEGGCGLGGGILQGRFAIDLLVDAKRIDILANVLRGYNPGGRVYAAIALRRLEREGLRLAPDLALTLNRVIDLDVPVSTCSGCIVNSGRRAKDVMRQFLEH